MENITVHSRVSFKDAVFPRGVTCLLKRLCTAWEEIGRALEYWDWRVT